MTQATGQAGDLSDCRSRKTQHQRYLEATKQYGLDYIPRFEWGGSQDLPIDARTRSMWTAS